MEILVTGAFNYSAQQRQILEKLGEKLLYLQDEKGTINFDITNVEYVICNGLFLWHDIKQFKNLKYIQLTSAGMDRIPMDYIKQHNITVFNARGVYSIPIAEWTILKILEIYKKSRKFYELQKIHKWEKQRDLIELNGKTACIIGYGSIGHEIAIRLKAFNVKLKIVDMHNPKDDSLVYYPTEKINEAISNSDIIILTLPLTDETRKSINKEKFELMKNSAILVNISRGQIINEKDLIEQLDKGKFLGVILDVFQEEPLSSDSKLWDYNNTIITPHNCFVSDNNNEKMFEVIKNNINMVKEGFEQ